MIVQIIYISGNQYNKGLFLAHALFLVKVGSGFSFTQYFRDSEQLRQAPSYITANLLEQMGFFEGGETEISLFLLFAHLFWVTWSWEERQNNSGSFHYYPLARCNHSLTQLEWEWGM